MSVNRAATSPIEAALAFAEHFGASHTALALHAVVPLGLTPEILHLIRVNFLRHTPWIAEADILLSPMCQHLGGEMYEFFPETRRFLLNQLQKERRFQGRLTEIARFLAAYTYRSISKTTDQELREFLEAQHFAALAYLDPKAASKAIALAFRHSAEKDPTGLLRIADVANALSVPLYSERRILLYTTAIEQIASGGEVEISHFLDILGSDEYQVEGIILPSIKLIANLIGSTFTSASEPTQQPTVEVSDNPFTLNPVTAESAFTGRKREIDFVLKRLSSPGTGSISIVGNRRIGKTSLLRYLATREHSLLPRSQEFRFLYLDFFSTHARSISEVMRLLRQAWDQQGEDQLWSPEADGSLIELAEGFSGQAEKGVLVILCLDEFDTVFAYPELEPFLNVLRSVASQGIIGIITASQNRLIDLELSNKRVSPFADIFAVLTLGLMPTNEWKTFVRDGFALSGQQVSDDQIKLIGELAGGHPYLTQIASALVWEFSDDVAAARHKFQEAARPIFRDFFLRDTLPHNHLWLQMLSIGINPPLRERVRQDLQQRGLLTAEGKLFSQSFSDFIRQETEVTRELLLALLNSVERLADLIPYGEQFASFRSWKILSNEDSEVYQTFVRCADEVAIALKSLPSSYARQLALQNAHLEWRRVVVRLGSSTPLSESDTAMLEKISELFTKEAKWDQTPPDTSYTNPYIVGNPLTFDRTSLFKGRIALAEQITTALEHKRGNVIILQGERRIGKTSFLLHLEHLLPSIFFPVFLDLQGAASSQGDSAFFYALTRAIHHAIRTRMPEALAEKTNFKAFKDNPYQVFEDYLEATVMPSLGEQQLLLVLDEFEAIQEAVYTQGRMTEQVFMELRRLVNHTPPISIVISVATQADPRLSRYFISAQQFILGYLDESSGRDLILDPTNELAISTPKYDEEVVVEILRLTRGHPFLIQALCSELVDQANATNVKRINRKLLDVALQRILTTFTMYFEYLWANASEPGQKILSTLVQNPTMLPADDTTVQRLVNSHTIERLPDGRYAIEIPLVAEWIRLYRD